MADEIPGSILDKPTPYEGTYLEFLGFKLVAWKSGYAKLEMPVRAEHRNTVGFLHGGVIASLLDISGDCFRNHQSQLQLYGAAPGRYCNR